MFSLSNKPVVLVIDDEPVNIEVLAALLSKDYQIKVATNGQVALDLAQRAPQPDLILLDIMMPGLDGFEVCKQLKAKPETQDIPVIFVTAAGAQSESTGFDLGAVDYIAKPINSQITKLRVKAHVEIAQSRKRITENLGFLSSMIENAPLAVFVLSPDQRWLLLNKVGLNVLECGNLYQATQQSTLKYIDEQDIDKFSTMFHAALSGSNRNKQLQMVGGNGNKRWIDLRLTPLRDAAGKINAVLGIGIDITENKQTQSRLRLLAKVFENTLEGILISDLQGNTVDVNPAYSQISGVSREEILDIQGDALRQRVQDDQLYEDIIQTINATGQWQGEIVNRKKNGGVVSEWLTVTLIRDQEGNPEHYLSVFGDIGLLKKHKKDLEKIAHYDSLTGLPNRALLVGRIKKAIEESEQELNSFAVCYFDLDDFKPINDQFGQDVGDAILLECSKRINSTVRGIDTLARVGGDEFVILLNGIRKVRDCTATLDRLLLSIANPIQVGTVEHRITASISVTFYPQDNDDADMLLRHADQAMYVAKTLGKNCYNFFDAQEYERMRSLSAELTRIRQALTNSEFELFYQPKVDLINNAVIGAEALIRWRHPERGIVSPADFLPQIHETDLEIILGEWVIATALAQQQEWNQLGLRLELSINISAKHLQSPSFISYLQQQLSKYPQLPPDTMQIDVLETAALDDFDSAIKIMQACHALGVRFALDDFGTGYSWLSYLCKLPANTIKIDQTFIRDMLSDEGSYAIVVGIIALAKTFSREIVAEGVETANHYSTLAEMGCNIAQGYGIARPMPASDFFKWCQSEKLGAHFPALAEK